MKLQPICGNICGDIAETRPCVASAFAKEREQ